MRSSVAKGARLAATTALVSVLAFGLVLGNAGADLQSFSANATGYALKVTVDLSGLPLSVKSSLDSQWTSARNALPEAQRSSVPAGFPYKVEQSFLSSTSDASPSANKAISTLSDGTFAARSDWVVSADAPGQDRSSNVLSAKFGDPTVLNVSLINANAGVLKASVAAGPKVDGTNTLAQVATTLQAVGSLLGNDLNTAFAGVLTALNSTLSSGASTFNQTINTAAGAAGTAVTGTALGDVLASQGVNVSNLANELNLPTNLAIPNGLTIPTFATVTDVSSRAIAQRNGDLTVSDASSAIKSVDVLSGFVSTGLINLSSHSEASGKKDSAKNASSCSLADIRVGGQNGIAFDGKSLYVKGTAVPVPPDQVNAVKSQVDSILGQAGVSIKLCDAASGSTAADGTSANQKVSAFVIDIRPKVPADTSTLPTAVQTALTNLGLSANQALGIHVIIDPTVQTQVQAAQAPATEPAQLPRTGAPAILTALSGLALMAAGVALRHRVR